MTSARDNHPPCPCGKELADECMCPYGDPLGSMRIEPPIGSRTRKICDLGVGCEEYGRCYALAVGEPDRCGRS